jgi:aspartyl/glutamyl-tRNA(Asn/Gln) amidotransferase C subunit
MAQINIKHLEKLAKLDLPPEEEKSLKQDLANLVARFDELKAFGSLQKTTCLGDQSQPSSTKQPLRADEVIAQDISIEQVLDQSPNRLGSAFGVPKVL